MNQPLQVLPADFDDLDEGEKEELLQLKEKVEQAVKRFPQHSYISFIATVRLNQEQPLEPVIQTIIVNNKAPVLIGKFRFFIVEDYLANDDSGLNISTWIQVQKLMSIILYTMSTNFSSYAFSPSISLLSADELKTILKHKRLKVFKEDEVALAFFMWHLGPKVTSSCISAVLGEINWNYVSTRMLL